MKRKPWATLVCQHCGAPFSVQPSRARTAKFCGKACFGAANTRRAMVRIYGNTGEMKGGEA